MPRSPGSSTTTTPLWQDGQGRTELPACPGDGGRNPRQHFGTFRYARFARCFRTSYETGKMPVLPCFKEHRDVQLFWLAHPA